MDDLSTLTVRELTDKYNAMVPEDRRIKKFESKAQGIARISKILPTITEEVETLTLISTTAPTNSKTRSAPPKKMSLSKRIQGLIMDGLTNEAIWAIVKPEFNLEDSKKTYPSWNRSFLARKARG